MQGNRSNFFNSRKILDPLCLGFNSYFTQFICEFINFTFPKVKIGISHHQKNCCDLAPTPSLQAVFFFFFSLHRPQSFRRTLGSRFTQHPRQYKTRSKAQYVECGPIIPTTPNDPKQQTLKQLQQAHHKARPNELLDSLKRVELSKESRNIKLDKHKKA